MIMNGSEEGVTWTRLTDEEDGTDYEVRYDPETRQETYWRIA